jgi:hypothetical protein
MKILIKVRKLVLELVIAMLFGMPIMWCAQYASRHTNDTSGQLIWIYTGAAIGFVCLLAAKFVMSYHIEIVDDSKENKGD